MMLLRFIDSTLLKEWTVQSLIVDQAHLVLVSSKQDLQKSYSLVRTKFKIGHGLWPDSPSAEKRNATILRYDEKRTGRFYDLSI